MRRMSWTLRVPFQNIKNFIVLRPPAALFALCIATFAIVTLTLALYVKHTTSPLKNPDEKDWNDLAVKFNRLNFCLLPIGVAPSVNTSGMEAASVPFSMVLPADDVWKKFTVISGSVTAAELGLNEYPGTNLSFSLSLMQSQNKICLNLFHPSFVRMPRGGPPSCNSLQFNPFPQSIGAFVLPREDKRSTTVIPKCPNNTAFDVNLVENPDWTIYLERKDRRLVSLHLMTTSAILMVAFLFVLCFAAVRGASLPKQMKTPSTSRVETSGIKDSLTL